MCGTAPIWKMVQAASTHWGVPRTRIDAPWVHGYCCTTRPTVGLGNACVARLPTCCPRSRPLSATLPQDKRRSTLPPSSDKALSSRAGDIHRYCGPKSGGGIPRIMPRTASLEAGGGAADDSFVRGGQDARAASLALW
jgi:hypothetical protein